MSSIEQSIRHLSDESIQIHLWRTAAGYQANVKENASSGWTVVIDTDPIAALALALRQRVARVSDREVMVLEDEAVVEKPAAVDDRQLDIEDAIAADDDFEGLL